MPSIGAQIGHPSPPISSAPPSINQLPSRGGSVTETTARFATLFGDAQLPSSGSIYHFRSCSAEHCDERSPVASTDPNCSPEIVSHFGNRFSAVTRSSSGYSKRIGDVSTNTPVYSASLIMPICTSWRYAPPKPQMPCWKLRRLPTTDSGTVCLVGRTILSVRESLDRRGPRKQIAPLLDRA